MVLFLAWLPVVVLWVIAGATAAIHFFTRRDAHAGGFDLVRTYSRILWGTAIFRVLYAILLTIAQYIAWSHNALAKIFLNSPLMMPDNISVLPSWFIWLFKSTKGYFLFYAFGRFWLGAFLAIGVAFLWFLFLKALKRHRERFFDTGEVALGFLGALVVGWPMVVVFIPLIFFAVVIMSILRRLVWGYRYTTLGTPFVLAMLATLLVGPWLIQHSWLAVLKI